MRIASKTALSFAAFAAVCVGGSGLVLVEEFEDALLEGVRERQRLLVANRALVLRENLALASGELERLAAMAAIDLDDEDPGPEQRLLEQAYHQTSFFNERLEVYGRAGRCRWSVPGDAGCSVADAQRAPWFRDAVRDPPATHVYVSEAGEAGHVDLVTPVVRDGREVGILRGVVDLHGDLMFSPALHDELSASTRVALVTSDRRAAVRSGGDHPWDERTWAEAMAAAEGTPSGAAVVAGEREAMLVAWASVERADLHLTFAWPLDELDDAVERQVRNLTLAITVVGILALVTGLLVARWLTAPMRRLVDEVRQIEAGAIHALPPTDREDEVADVERAIASLLRLLDEREAEIRDDRDRIAELAAHLEDRVDERTRELREAQDALVRAERMAAIGRAGTVLSHELRNALNAVSVAMDTLRSAGSDEPAYTARRTVRAEVARLRRLSDDLLGFARDPVVARAPSTAAELLELAVSVVEPHAREHEVTIELEPDERLSLEVDPDHLQTALVNLLRNAVDAAAERPPGRVRASARGGDDGVEIVIDDSGPGVAEEVRERLFQPFVTTRRQGLGLGLAIADRLVRAHGGSIRSEDGPLGGARFVVSLPADGGGAA